MANPVLVTIPVNAWTKVAAGVMAGNVYPVIFTTPGVYVYTVRHANDAAPVDGDLSEAVELSQANCRIVFTTPIDIYVAVTGLSAGKVRIDTSVSPLVVDHSQIFTTVAVDYDRDPGGPFKWIDAVFEFNIVPVVAGLLTLKTIRGSYEVPELSFDPSVTGVLKIVARLDKDFADGVTFGVDYANPSSRTVTVLSSYKV